MTKISFLKKIVIVYEKVLKFARMNRFQPVEIQSSFQFGMRFVWELFHENSITNW